MVDFKRVDDAIKAAKRRAGGLGPLLDQVNFRVIIEQEAAHVRHLDGPVRSYPIEVGRMSRGFYYIEHDAQRKLNRMAPLDGDRVYHAIQLDGKLRYQDDAGNVIEPPFVTEILLGDAEYSKSQLGTNGVYWVTVDVLPKPKGDRQPEEEFPLRFYPPVPPDEVAAQLAHPGTRRESVAVPGPGPGVSRFWPDHYEAKPLNFTYLAHNDQAMLVKRRMVGRDFHFWVRLNDVEQFLFSYVIDTIGRNTAGMAIYAQLVTEIAMSFIPIVGPLYDLFQTGVAVRDAYKNWGKMSGWEKALVGFDVLLTTVTVAPSAVRAGKGLAKVEDGTKALMAAGLPKGEAKTLMVAAGVFQDVPATRLVVETLIQQTKSGKILTAKQIKQLEDVLEQMMKRLPAADRALAAARFAMSSPQRARAFLEGLEITTDAFEGLKKLSPEAIVAIQGLAKEQRATLALRLVHWAKDGTIARGMNKLAEGVRPQHVAELTAALGEDLLKELGQLPGLHDLMSLAKAQSGSNKAYRVLIEGGKLKGGKVVIGLDDLLKLARRNQGTLPTELAAIQAKTTVFLTEKQLAGLARLGERTREALMAAPDSQLRELSKIASRSSGAAKGIERLSGTLAGKLRGGVFTGILERMGTGLLEAVERLGITIPPDLVAELARKADAADAMKLLISGSQKAKKAIPGLFEQMALALNETRLSETLKRIQNTTLRGELFSRWAILNSDKIPGVASVLKIRPSDGRARLAAIYRDFDDAAARSIFSQLGKMDGATPPEGLSELIADLGAGPDKAMGASLTLQFVSQKLGTSKVLAFEKSVQGAGSVVRKYDLVAGGRFYEFKYWLGYGGNKVDAAMDEFRRDILIHASTGFENLRWVFSREVQGYRDTIADLMIRTLDANQQAVKNLGFDFAKVRSQLDRAVNSDAHWLIDFH